MSAEHITTRLPTNGLNANLLDAFEQKFGQLPTEIVGSAENALWMEKVSLLTKGEISHWLRLMSKILRRGHVLDVHGVTA
jgi:hypothetical protein